MLVEEVWQYSIPSRADIPCWWRRRHILGSCPLLATALPHTHTPPLHNYNFISCWIKDVRCENININNDQETVSLFYFLLNESFLCSLFYWLRTSVLGAACLFLNARQMISSWSIFCMMQSSRGTPPQFLSAVGPLHHILKQ